MSVYALGVGMTRFTQQPDRSPQMLGAAAGAAAMADAGLRREQVGALFCGSVFGGIGIGQLIARELGMSRLPVVNLENACASSGVALRNAIAWVASGGVETALVIGVEQLTARGPGLVKSDSQGPSEQLGLTLPGLYAMHAQRYLAESGGAVEDLALVAVKNRGNGAMNPDAHFQAAVTVEQVLESPMIATPLTRLQCCPSVDGAAAVAISSARSAGDSPAARGIAITGWGMVSGNALDVPGSEPEATRLAGDLAYEVAGVGPDDIDVAELHEPFTIAELEHCESLGFAARGEALNRLREGSFALDGNVAVNPSGGLLSRGHPLGASGAAQIVEIVRQLRGDAADRQVPGARIGLAHIMGGNITEIDSSACTVHVLCA
ncbi:MAG TPA: thiolase family protein [Mycobacteriales bacterium]|nr:thiolase family protein [Mycobacteriales bacterium]